MTDPKALAAKLRVARRSDPLVTASFYQRPEIDEVIAALESTPSVLEALEAEIRDAAIMHYPYLSIKSLGQCVPLGMVFHLLENARARSEEQKK